MQPDFGQYILRKRDGFAGERGGDRYAYSADLRMLRTMRSFKPIELAVSSTVRLGKTVFTGDLLGSAVKVGPNQYPRVHRIARECADTLGIVPPQVFIQGRIDSMNAMTTGTDKESVIAVYAAMIENFSDEELRFVIGHECGHIQNGHVVYLTTLTLLGRVASLMLGWFVQPAMMALQSWSRAAEVTCDRAGLLCCKDEAVAQRALLKLVVGSMKLYEEFNVDEYLAQLKEGNDGFGRAAEMTKSHPYVSKRVQALRLFAASDTYRSHAGLSGGRVLTEIDQEVEALMKVV